MSSDINKKISNEADLETLTSNLCTLMSKNNIDSSELSKKTGIALTTINGLRRGSGNPTLSTLNLLADFFDITIGQLTEKDMTSGEKYKDSVQEVPLLTLEDLSEFLKNETKYKHTISTELQNWKPDKYYAIKLNNNSMNPLFEKGSIFIIAKDMHMHDGDMVLVQFGNHTPCFRKIFVEGNSYFFKTISELLNGRIVKDNNFTIYGVVVKAIQHFQDR